MILRVLALAAGMTGAAALSQFPEFSQQYRQRLGGAVDELARVVADFDRDAASVGRSRDAALAELRAAGTFGAAHARSMDATLDRHDRLAADLAALADAGAFLRAGRIAHLSDPAIARATWRSYRPALPLTFSGGVFAALGFMLAWAPVALSGRLARRAGRSKRPGTAGTA